MYMYKMLKYKIDCIQNRPIVLKGKNLLTGYYT
jgi:hypothetical protein